MRILAAADFHGKPFRYQAVREAAAEVQPDIAVLAGDVNGSADLFRLLNKLDLPTLVVHGNMDSISIREPITDTGAIFLHNHAYIHDDVSFIGIGGASPQTDVVTMHGSNEQQRLDKTTCDILVTHVPPKGVKDAAMLGRHIGSDWVRTFVMEREPRLVICGHVHEDRGHAWLNRTMVVNCTIGKGGACSIIDINRDVSVRHV